MTGCGSTSPGGQRCTDHLDRGGPGRDLCADGTTSWATPGSTPADPLPQRTARPTVTVTHDAMRTLIAERNRAMSALEAIARGIQDDASPVALRVRQEARLALTGRNPAPVTLDDVTVVPAAAPSSLTNDYGELMRQVRTETEDTL